MRARANAWNAGGIILESKAKLARGIRMKKSSTLGIATVLLLATSVVGLAEQAGTATAAAVDCNAVFKAKAAADKTISSQQLARDLSMPVKQVNKCLRRMRHVGPRSTPRAGN